MTNKNTSTSEQIDPTKSMVKEAIGIWSEEGEEAQRGSFAEPLDLTKFLGDAIRVEFIRTEEYDYKVGKDDRHGVSHVCKLLKTSAKGLQDLVGKEVGVYGKGLLNFQMKQLHVKAGDICIISFGEKQQIPDSDKEAWQTFCKVVKRA